jgi:cytochrome c
MVFCMLSLSGLVPAYAQAQQAQEALAKANNCLTCHGVNNKIVGPAFKDIAAKYVDTKDAEAMLTQKLLKGGSGVWGPIPMPPNPQIAEADARNLVRWVLTQK